MFRRLLRSVLRFWPKQVWMNSRNCISLRTPSDARSPGKSIRTSAEVTRGGGRNAPGGIRSTNKERKHAIMQEVPDAESQFRLKIAA
jgi:hypothetical protein